MTELYEKWHRRVRALARSFLPDDAEAEDATQEIFVELWKRLPRYDAQRGSSWAWIAMIARSRCIDRIRALRRSDRAARCPRLDFAQRDSLAQEDSCDAERLRRALGQLPREQRTAIDLSYFRGLSHREIALHTREPLGTVKTRLRLALGKLSSLLREPPSSEQPIGRAGRSLVLIVGEGLAPASAPGPRLHAAAGLPAPVGAFAGQQIEGAVK